MAGHSYEESKKIVLKTILILGAITLVEVLLALTGKGYIHPEWNLNLHIVGFFMITLSMAKAYFIVFEFMHMKYEARSLVRSVLLPTLLLVWGIIAFLWDGNTWGERRVKDSPQIEITLPEDQIKQKIEGTDQQRHDSTTKEMEGEHKNGTGGH